MKSKRMLLYVLVMLLPMISVGFANTGFAQTDTIDIPRDQSVWMQGYWQDGKSSMNPLTTPNVASGTYFMFVPLFETNPQVYTDYLNPDNLIPMVGKSASWSSDGSKLNVELRPEAKWSDGSPVDSDDVVWSMQKYIELRFTDTLGPAVSSVAPGADKLHVVINLNSGYHYSEDVFETLLIGDHPPLPKHIFENFANDFSNNWFFETGFQDSWKVVDGPYQPYKSTTSGNIHVYERVDSWWMDGLKDTKNNITYRMPEPKYIVSFHAPDNFVLATALVSGQIDLSGAYVENIKSLITKPGSYVHSWVEGGGVGGNQYFPLVSAMNEVVFNHQAGYPLNQVWFRKALAAAINYQDISTTAASGYLKQASATWLDSDQPSMAKYYNATLANQWKISPSYYAAESFLLEGAYKNTTDGVKWYTKDAPLGALWSVTNQTITQGMDAFPDVPGINILLGGWEIYCVTGWTDHMASLQLIVNNWKTLGINMKYQTYDYGTFITKRDTHSYTLYYSSLGNALANTPLNVMQYFTSTIDTTRNTTQWINPEFENALLSFSTATTDAQKVTDMNTMQNILGEVMPAIPVTVNCYWYAYSDQYWQGWPNDRGDVKGKF
ncbi:MAG: ABC transporter substrate-binding protein, partial [Candidatus Thorarchaeota archaeon]